MFKRIKTIAWQVFKTKIVKISYYWMIFAPVILLIVIFGLTQYLSQDAKDKKPYVAISAPESLKKQLLNKHASSYHLEYVKADDNLLNVLVKDGGSIDAAIKISNNFDSVSIIRNTYSDKEFPETAIKQDINALKINFEAKKQNLSVNKLNQLFSPPNYDMTVVSSDNDVSNNSFNGLSDVQMFSNICTIIIFVLIGSYINIISSEIGREKGGHVIESVLSAVSAKVQFAGKILGTIYLLIFQLLCYLLIVIAVKILNPVLHVNHFVSADILKNISYQYIIISITLMVIALLTYVLLAALLASLVSKVEDIPQVTNLSSLLLLVPYGISLAGSMMPNNVIIKILSFLPFASQNIMPMRIASHATSYLAGYIAISISIVCVLVLYWIASNVYANYALNFDNKNIIRKIWQLIS